MKHNLLTSAIALGIAMNAQAGPRDIQNRPHIEPVMRLRPVAGVAGTYELLIYGDIGESWWGESVTAQSVAQQLNDLDATVATINVRINSYGGSVADGLAIYNALKRHKATKAVTVDGVAMSSASLIAMAGDTVTMPSTSILMIHAPWGGIMGNAKEMRQYADVLDTFSKSMVDAYTAKSGMDKDEMLALLTDGDDHYYTGDEAVVAGFADAVAEDSADTSQASAEEASAFAAALIHRISAKAPAKYAGLAVAAAMRGAGQRSAPKPAESITIDVDTTSTDAIVADIRALLLASSPPAKAEHTPPAAAGNPPGETTVTEEEKKALAKAAVAADKARREAIRAQFAPFMARKDLDAAALIALRDECEADDAATPEAAGQKLLALLGKETAPIAGNHRIEAGSLDETNTYREGAQLAVLNRANPSAHKLDEKAREFRSFDLLDLGRDCLERAGIKTRGMTKDQIAIRAMQSTSDFPNILEAVVTKSLRAGYAGTLRTFTPFCRQATLPDFKQISRTQLGGAPSLKRVLEGAEYEQGVIGDGAEKYSVAKYGRLVAITWETIINDDLDALTRIPQAFGASAADLESDLVYAVLTGTSTMSDNVALFNGAHGNLGSSTPLADALATSPTLDPIAEMREMMLLQKGIEGRYISVRPKYLIVPPKLEQTALRLTSASFVAAKGGDINVQGVTLTPIVEARLHDTSDTAYYGAAEPSTIDTIEYAYLQGHEGVFTETKAGFEIDGIQVKCRHVFGAKAIDWRGLWKDAGT